MNMNKTILATLITTAFSSNVIAQSVDVELANLATEKAIQSQMDSIDTSTLAKLNAQNNKVVELNGVVYEQDDSGVWKAIGTGALGLTAALFSGSSNSSSNGSSAMHDYEQGPVLPDADNGPIKDKPSLPIADNDLKAQWSVGEDEKGRKALMNNGEVVAYVANDGTRLRNADNEPLGSITSSVNGNGVTTYSVTLNNNSQYEGATITYREGNAGNQNFTITSDDGQTTYHWRQDRGFYKVDTDNNWGVVPEYDHPVAGPDDEGSIVKPDDKPDYPVQGPGEDIDPDFQVKPEFNDKNSSPEWGITPEYDNPISGPDDEGSIVKPDDKPDYPVQGPGEDIDPDFQVKPEFNDKDSSPEWGVIPEYDNPIAGPDDEGSIVKPGDKPDYPVQGPGEDIDPDFQIKPEFNDKDSSPEWGITPEYDNPIAGPDDEGSIVKPDDKPDYPVQGPGENIDPDFQVKPEFNDKDSSPEWGVIPEYDHPVAGPDDEGSIVKPGDKPDYPVQGPGEDIDPDFQVKPEFNDKDSSPEWGVNPEISGGEGSQELIIKDGGIFFGGEKIGFIASDGNVNLYEKGKVGTVTATSGGGNVSQITLNGGQTIDIARNQGNAMKTTITANNGSQIVIDHSDGSITTVKPRPEVDKPEFELPSFERVSIGEIEVDKDNQTIKINDELFYLTEGGEFVTIDGKRILLSKDENHNITLHSAQGDLLATVHAAKIGGGIRLVVHADGSRTFIGEQGRMLTIDADKKNTLKSKAGALKAKIKAKFSK
ncbi:hypothetical protein [Vibrio bathopelagicus]|uniref:hypothetical protein n=1 Tax=Vibrio bathopelagicus TaxID=2777577 RepID=UPI0018653990|nr:hypothetical protein [Vibrio bathopelagicus]